MNFSEYLTHIVDKYWIYFQTPSVFSQVFYSCAILRLLILECQISFS